MDSMTQDGRTQEIFFNWFTFHFLKHSPAVRPLLLLDGHSTYYNPEFIHIAANEKVTVFCFPLSTTHLTQPLDKGVFGPLKVCWNEECQKFMNKNPGKVVTQYDFMTVFSKAWYHAMSIPNIMGAFQTTGIHPLHCNAIEISESTHPLDSEKESLTEKTGLAFIPFYTPNKSCKSKPKTIAPPTDTDYESDASSDNTDDTDEGTEFTEEHTRYERRLEEGYNIKSDHTITYGYENIVQMKIVIVKSYHVIFLFEMIHNHAPFSTSFFLKYQS